jgi:hypothetical protein
MTTKKTTSKTSKTNKTATAGKSKKAPAKTSKAPAPKAKVAAKATAKSHDPNAPAIGTTLKRSFKGKDIVVKVTADGFVRRQTFCQHLVRRPSHHGLHGLRARVLQTGRAEARGQGGQVMSGPSIAAQVVALGQLNVAQLRERWREIFGEETKQRHRQFLIRRIAWELQRRESGEELSPEALKRLDELQDEFRNSPPSEWFKGARHNRPVSRAPAYRQAPAGGGHAQAPAPC